jgi:putative oxidoreductase
MPSTEASYSNTRFPSALRPYAAIPLRLVAGAGLVQHGWAKMVKGPEDFAAILESLHVPLPHLSAYATISVELLGGLALLLGAFVVWASVPAIIVLLTAMFTVHLPYGFSSIKLLAVVDGRAKFGPPGYECDLLYIAAILTLILLNPGPLSVDHYRLRKRNFGVSPEAPA